MCHVLWKLFRAHQRTELNEPPEEGEKKSLSHSISLFMNLLFDPIIPSQRRVCYTNLKCVVRYRLNLRYIYFVAQEQ